MTEIREIIQQNIFWLIIVSVVLLLMGLMYQLKMQVRRLVRNEIYDHFPTIKKKMEDYEISLHHLEVKVQDCERRLKGNGTGLQL